MTRTEQIKAEARIEGLKRFKRDCEEIAKEVLEVEAIGDDIYVFGSELATLRLFHKHNLSGMGNKYVKAGFSENLNKFYFRLERRFS